MRTETVIAAIGAFVVLAVIVALGTSAQPTRPPTPRTPVDRSAPPPAVPALPPGTDVVAWAGETAKRTDIPERTLQAYGTAELRQRAATPDCRLSWVTLAGVGRIETRHAQYRGTRPDAAGRAVPPIVGIPLDGTDGTRRMTDSDGGRLDGDPRLDRAVGPMQFLPRTWERFGADGNGDGVADPQQVDDAALAAAGLLCARDRDLSTGEAWWSGVLAYNASGEYAGDVWAAAGQYARDVTSPGRN